MGAPHPTQWLWGRARRHIVAVILAVQLTVLFSGIVVPTSWFVSLYFELTFWESSGWGVTLVIALWTGGVVGTVASRRLAEPLRAWARGDSDDVGAARAAALALPGAATRATVPTQAVIALVVCLPYLVSTADLGAPELAGAVAASAMVVVGSAFLAHVITVALLRPALLELAELVPATVPAPAPGSSVTTRVLIAITISTMASGLATPSIVSLTDTIASRWVAAVAASLCLTAYMSLLFLLMLRSWVSNPLHDLAAAVRRVGRGELGEAVAVTSTDELGELAIALNEMQAGLREREVLHAAFGSYVDPGLARRLLEQGSSTFRGEDVELSVLFVDVRDFTAYSERVSSADAVAMLNDLFDIVVPVVHEHGGHANHYLGDGLLAVFGAPEPLERHADAAVAASVEIQRRVRREMAGAVRLGIGVNSGPVIAGTVGGGGRLEFTVIGDTVNIASRVEQLTKETGDAILITEATRAALSTPRPRTTRRGQFTVRGKADMLTLHALNPFPRTPKAREVGRPIRGR